MDLPTLKELDNRYKPTFYVGLGNRKLLIEEGLTNVVELDWWDIRHDKDLKIKKEAQKKNLPQYFKEKIYERELKIMVVGEVVKYLNKNNKAFDQEKLNK